MSGTGKSTALENLGRRGHAVVDTDDPGWIVQIDTVDGPEPMWDLDRVRALIEQHHAGWLFIAAAYPTRRRCMTASTPSSCSALQWRFSSSAWSTAANPFGGDLERPSEDRG
jgi:hypothetical protein